MQAVENQDSLRHATYSYLLRFFSLNSNTVYIRTLIACVAKPIKIRIKKRQEIFVVSMCLTSEFLKKGSNLSLKVLSYGS